MTRIAVIEKKKCNPSGCGGWLCMKLCPVNRTGQECIVKGEDSKPVIDEELCTGCGICPNRCPFEAIHIINLPEELTSQPIHRYGKNGFRLYNLPNPLFGKVVGLLGVNGIGKSTAIKVLAGVLKPNLGEEKESTYDELLNFFKGTEAQIFFERMKKQDITVSYKPQQVDLIPQTVEGTVIDLLKNVDEKGKLDKVVQELQIDNILDHNIKDISGGELQRVAIAACVLKKANLYILDEPNSYLDIKQRLRMAKFIRKLVNSETSVLIIEHDLIALDYMTDIIHIMYGKEAAYGIVSNPRTTKQGINTYLEGYLKEENIRFRDHKIRFDIRPPEESKKRETLVQWPVLKKKLGNFDLKSDEGEVKKKEIIGVLGENGIGKTSFVKLLAGVEKPDSGKLDLNVKVSYKPQYIDTTSDELVMNVLKDAIKNHETDIIRPLNLKPLFMRKINELSGGELQRVAVAKTLGIKADICLLDEPSAYLDVEQRLIVSKVVKNVCEISGRSAMVVDHDLLFIDNLSDKLMVFDGNPAINGIAKGPFKMEEGMNSLLTEVNITLRRDEESGRPRVNKEDSVKDRQQKSKNKYYYS